MKFGIVLVVGPLLGLALVAAKKEETPASPAQMTAKTLLQRPLAAEFTRGREVIVDLVEIPPHTTLDRHWHPGEEFHYYLEGEVEIAIEGQSPFVGKPGAVGHVPYKKLHTAKTGEERARILVFRVHTEGEPARYLEKQEGAGRPPK